LAFLHSGSAQPDNLCREFGNLRRSHGVDRALILLPMKGTSASAAAVATRPCAVRTCGLPVRNSPGDVIRIPLPMQAQLLDDVPLSMRMRNVLTTAGYRSLGDLEGHRFSELERLRNCGKASLLELQAMIRKGKGSTSPFA
jgi:Bacterial RNA polymerase, alpha chain C terminal domain